jgi:3-methyladenine DNA glycosylase AlkC
MEANRELTKRFSAEASVRPFIARDPERAFGYFRRWAADPNPHVRRLVSEGTRLRLPWAPRVAWLDRHPERVVELLVLLRDDPTTVVRRSVANNLNDLGKVAPALLVEVCADWLGTAASRERRALVEHALRSAVKRAVPGALALLGYGDHPRVEVAEVTFAPATVSIGGVVDFACELVSTAAERQELLVDLAVHFVKAKGQTSPKIFKLDRVTLDARGRVRLAKRISLAVHTTREPRPGRHRVEVVVNGLRFPAGAFEVVAAPP